MQQISPIKLRILQYLESKQVTKYQYYKHSNTTRGVLDKTTGISEDNIAKFLAYAPNVSPQWLILGTGPTETPHFQSIQEPQPPYTQQPHVIASGPTVIASEAKQPHPAITITTQNPEELKTLLSALKALTTIKTIIKIE